MSSSGGSIVVAGGEAGMEGMYASLVGWGGRHGRYIW